MTNTTFQGANGETYTIVHTNDANATGVAQAVINDGQLQHVVMEAPDGVTDNIVLQVQCSSLKSQDQ